jgi:sugar phosphate isomerase/epimerase
VPDDLRLAVSNIAWNPEEDESIGLLLRAEGVSGIEVAPTKWRANPLEASAREIAEYRRVWADRGLRIVSLQSLLFGRPELQLFGDTRAALADVLLRVIDLGAELGAHALVFGSPRNRIRGAISPVDAMSNAVDFFRPIGDHASAQNVTLCIEANPPEYGCDFVTTTAEAIMLCDAINNRGIGVNGDLGGMTMSGDEPTATIAAADGLLGHFHASEPNLAELGAESDHETAGEALRAISYERWISIEMRGATDNITRVGRAVRYAKAMYGRSIPAP